MYVHSLLNHSDYKEEKKTSLNHTTTNFITEINCRCKSISTQKRANNWQTRRTFLATS